MADFGYAGKILKVDLSSGSNTVVSTRKYTDRFIGGRGLAAKIYWDEVSPTINAFHTENRLIFTTGPLAGLPTLGGSRWQVCGKSPATTPEQFCYSNLGGRWGAELKFAGYDAIVVQGRADNPVYLFLHDDVVELKDASALWGKGSIETREILKSEFGSSSRVVAIGPAGENLVTMAILLADNDASGAGGLGAVMGSKNLKAIVVKGSKQGVMVAHPERFRGLISYYRKIERGFPYIYFATDQTAVKGHPAKKEPCYGCLGNCHRMVYKAEDGKKGKFMCHSGLFYQPYAEQYYGGWSEVPFHTAKLCDDYGLDTMAVNMMVFWLWRCYRAGILSDEKTGIPISKLGSIEFIETLVKKVSLREGYGDILAHGTVKAADVLGSGAREQIGTYLAKAGHMEMYGPRLYITTALLYAMEPRPPIQQLHEVSFALGRWLNWVKEIEGAYLSSDVIRNIAKRFWGGEIAADFSTYEGKALATKKIQDRQYVKECLILCDWAWPIIETEHSEDHVGDPSLESRIFSAVTGKELDEEELNQAGERVFNLQRAILIREGHRGREDDSLPDSWHTTPLKWDFTNPGLLVPGKDGEIISRKGAVVDRVEFERMKTEYYQLRQWDVTTGLQTRIKLDDLDLKEIAVDLEQRGLLA